MLELFQYTFIIRAFAVGTMIAVVAPMVGMFVVVRRYSLVADTLAHVALLGVSIALISKLPVMPIVLLVVIGAAVMIEWLRQRQRLGGESVLALFLSGSLALSIAIMTYVQSSSSVIVSALFGSIITVSTSDVIITAAMSMLIVFVIVLLYRPMIAVALDEDLAHASGLPVRLLNTVTVVLAALIVGLAMQTVGVLLIGALLVIPVLTAQRYGLGFVKTTLVAILISVSCVVVGLYISYYFAIASGASIVLTTLAAFILTSMLVRRQR